ncbi:MAG: ABC transporter substrate-binding protein [Bacteroidetes bacterium]|nr:MAG: ABC transporter substrate-binding protein [Bacteroidota bacterium]
MRLYPSWRNPRLLFILFLTTLITASCKQKEGRENTGPAQAVDERISSGTLKTVSVYPYWVATSQFAGYYVGKEKGIFRRHGIDLRILEYKPFITTNDIIKKNQADFAILWLVNAIQMRSSGINIVNIAQFSTRSSLMLLAKKSSGIKKITDLNGKRAGIWDGYDLQPKALFAKYNLNTEIVPIGSTNNLFLQGGVDVINANWFDEYHAILNSGYNEDELVPFFFADYGLNFLEDGIYCLEDKLKSDPVTCIEFVKATIESWEYALSHPDESVEIILKYQRIQKMPANSSHQHWMIDRYKDLYLPAGKTTLNIRLSEKDYMSNAKILLDSKQISHIPDYKEFFRPYTNLLHSSTDK